jgi:DNA-binding transcriptional ArsR family regulator
MRALDSNTILILTFVIAPLSDASEVRQRRDFRIHQSVAGRSWGIMPTMDKFCDVSPAEVAAIASVLSDPARAAILISLVDGCARTAGELAFVAGISAPTASSHLAKLVDSGLITVIPQGPHRCHRLVRLETAQALEALTVLAAAYSWAQNIGLFVKRLRRPAGVGSGPARAATGWAAQGASVRARD